MNLTINGQSDEVIEGTTVADLLSRLELQPVRVAVEINEELVSRRTFAEHELRDGDHIEIVTLVGGG